LWHKGSMAVGTGSKTIVNNGLNPCLHASNSPELTVKQSQMQCNPLEAERGSTCC
jgi:hypothetical protein